ncbi:hypothetical protein FGIG_07657 [Fasciola gigantica]|uniref:Uncharacterized protein n=1 Tax=Fasciola gigantica TaxID=46835 RepID=A0A504Z2F4_FASGI|nr:hypothetical protein FGIG_07657 [Fasciola gigantica]
MVDNTSSDTSKFVIAKPTPVEDSIHPIPDNETTGDLRLTKHADEKDSTAGLFGGVSIMTEEIKFDQSVTAEGETGKETDQDEKVDRIITRKPKEIYNQTDDGTIMTEHQQFLESDGHVPTAELITVASPAYPLGTTSSALEIPENQSDNRCRRDGVLLKPFGSFGPNGFNIRYNYKEVMQKVSPLTGG